MIVLGISGSLRRDSFNTRLLREVAKELPDGVEFRLYDGLRDVPPYDEDIDGELAGADAVLFATPEYNFSIPGQLKNAIDWASRPAGAGALRFVPVAVVGSSTGAYGAVWAQAELRKVLGACGARVVEGDVTLGHAREAFATATPLSDEQRAQARELLADLMGHAARRAAAA